MPKFEFDVQLVPDNSLPAFGAYVAGAQVDEVPEIRINFNAVFAVCMDEPTFNWKEELADTVVHELLHLVQYKFGLLFDELQVDEAIEQARQLDRKTVDTEVTALPHGGN